MNETGLLNPSADPYDDVLASESAAGIAVALGGI